ncbi:MAG: sulfotransferase [Candidatus Promineifilaceae bacterium]
MVTRRNVQKYVRYIFDSESFEPHPSGSISRVALEAASVIRDVTRGPAIMLHGIMPRSGTVYVGELLRHHPDLYAYPHDIWELPFLERTGDIEKIQDAFIWSYDQNRNQIASDDFLPLFGASIIAYLHNSTPDGKRILLKIPGVQYLHRFYDVFPYENLLLLVRDGRDVVHSTVRTWPQIRFWMACLRWRRAANMSLYVNSKHNQVDKGFWLGRFEDAVEDPEAFVTNACHHFGLDVEKYPWEIIGNIPVQGSSSIDESGEVNWDPVEKPDGFQPFRHWRDWSPLRKLVFKRLAGEALRKLGYGDEEEW